MQAGTAEMQGTAALLASPACNVDLVSSDSETHDDDQAECWKPAEDAALFAASTCMVDVASSGSSTEEDDQATRWKPAQENHVELDLVSDQSELDEEDRPLSDLLQTSCGSRAPACSLGTSSSVVLRADLAQQRQQAIRWDHGQHRFEFRIRSSGRESIHFQTTVKAAGGSRADAERICHLCYDALWSGTSKESVEAYRAQLYRHVQCGESLDIPLDLTSLAQTSKSEHMPARAVRNKDFCEVCQKAGRLLLCATCPRAFHARCIEHFVNHEALVQNAHWTCPVCTQGVDVLHGLASTQHRTGDPHFRMADAARRDRKQWRAAERRRDAFLGRHLELLEAMATKATLSRVQRTSEAGSLLEMGALVDVTSSDAGTYRAMALAQLTSSSYIVANLATKAEAIVERKHLCEAAQPGECDGRDFLGHARKSVLAEGVILKGYQIAGVNWLIHACLNRCGGILADDMGLGKTIQALACLSYLRSSGTLRGPFLIVAPLSCVGNWVREAKRFVPHLSVAKLCGSAREKERALEDDEIWFGVKDIVITTYETTVSTEEFLQRHFWAAIVLDEAHRIKNESTRIREALDTVKCAGRLLLTGTPLQNNLGELFTLLRFLWPDVLLRVPESLENVARGPVCRTEPAADEALPKQLNALLQMLMLRRLKEDVIQLPPKVLRDVWLPLTPCQVAWYRVLLQSHKQLGNRSLSVLFKLLSRLRQAFCHPCCLTSSEQDRADLEQDIPAVAGMYDSTCGPCDPELCGDFVSQSSKLIFLDKLLMHLHAQNMCISTQWRRAFQERQYAQDASSSQGSPLRSRITSKGARKPLRAGIDAALFLREAHPWKPPESATCPPEAADKTHPDAEAHDAQGAAQPHKVLIFSQFRASIDLLEKYCKWRSWRTLRLDGNTHQVLRELDIRDFNSGDEDIFIYLLSTRAGGLGINLASANHVVIFDHDWNPQIDHQAIDRAHRITQERVVTVYRLIQEWSVEEKMVARQEEKLRMERSVVEAFHHEGRAVEEERMLNAKDKERLSSAEVLELLQYGEEAIQHFAGDCLSEYPLRWFLDRVRRPLLKPLPSEVAAAARRDLATDSPRSAGGVKRDVSNRRPDCEISPQRKKPKPGALEPEEPNQHQEHDTVVCWTASGRAVRRTVQFSATPMVSPKAVSKKLMLRHCTTCFVCGQGQIKGGSPKKGSNAVGTPPDMLCSLCPKAYHSTCLHPDAGVAVGIRGSRWLCSWHRCADCGRSPSLCGGLLISCMKCPTALCYECFPPNFRRVHPPDAFWADLNNHGWSVSREKMVLFLCNSCREAEEHMKQQQMTAEDLRARDDERQREALEEQRRLAELKRISEEEESQRQVRQLMAGQVNGELGPESSVGDLRSKLTEMGLPIYGTKEQLWQRLLTGKVPKKPLSNKAGNRAGRRTRKISVKSPKRKQRQLKVLHRLRFKTKSGHVGKAKDNGNSVNSRARRKIMRKSAGVGNNCTNDSSTQKKMQLEHSPDAVHKSPQTPRDVASPMNGLSPRIRMQGKQSPKKHELKVLLDDR